MYNHILIAADGSYNAVRAFAEADHRKQRP